MPKIFTLFFFCLLMNRGSAQNDTVTWAGGGYYPPGQPITTVMRKMGADKKMFLKTNSAGEVTGTLIASYDRARATLDNKSIDQSFVISGSYNAARNVLLLILTHIKSPDGSEPDRAFRKPDSVYYSVSITKEENKMVMAGTVNALMNRNSNAEWIGSSIGVGMGMNVSDDISMHLLPLRIRLESTQLPKPVAVIPPPPVKKEPLPLPARKTALQQTIILDTSFIKIDMYDNGEIDGDIATLILDGKTIIESQLLSTKAATISLNLSKEPAEHILEMFANNMGSIPPNTALLVLTCRKKRYEINLSSNTTVNGGVKLVVKSN